MRLVSIGDQVEEGIYPIHSRFKRTVNFRHNDRLVSVVDETIGAGPLNIVLRDLLSVVGAYRRAARCSTDRRARRSRPTEQANRVGPLVVYRDHIRFAGQTFRFTARHRYCSTLDCRSGPRFAENLSLFGELLKATSHPQSLAFLIDDRRAGNFRTDFEREFANQVRHSVNHIFLGNRIRGVQTLAGCGIGLTPSGDDFIAGHLIGLHWRGENAEEVFEAARSNNIFSNTFLDLARQGRLFGRMKNLLVALTHGSKAAVEETARSLFAVGGTSGADLGTGFYMTVCAA